jgi:glycosyltransferase involved in cell wall biosynthesis
MSAKVQFTIIIPTLNAGVILKDAINSILAQSYRDFEVLVMDGGSTDNTVAIARDCGSDKVKIISQSDHGLYDAMNKGVDASSGAWLYFLGSDDILYDDRVLEDVSDFIQREHSVDVVYGNVQSILLGEDYDGAFDRAKLLKRNICHQAIFYNRRVFDRIGYYNTKYSYIADYDFNVRCFYDSRLRIEHIPRRIAVYHSDGMSSQLVRFYQDEPVGKQHLDLKVFRQALMERYLMLNTLREVGASADYVEKGMEKQAKRLLSRFGFHLALFGTMNSAVGEFVRYDGSLPSRVRRLAWKSIRSTIRKLI